jgi:hypothetical protein
LDALTVGIEQKKVNWVLDADIRDFFTSLDHGWLEKFLGHRIADKRVLRLPPARVKHPFPAVRFDACTRGSYREHRSRGTSIGGSP